MRPSRRPYPGQRYRHGWVPVVSALRKSVTDLLASPDLRDATRVYGGTFAGHAVRVRSAQVEDGRLRVTASVHDRRGRKVASLLRTIGPGENGELVAEHGLRITRTPRSVRDLLAQAGRVAHGAPRPDPWTLREVIDAHDRHLDGWYRASGVSTVEIHADGESSLFWALRDGLDWRDGIPPAFLARLRQFAASVRPVRRMEARRILARIETGEHITPHDLASLVSGPDLFDGLSWVGVRVPAMARSAAARQAKVWLILRAQRR